jgi:hypothetical protein
MFDQILATAERLGDEHQGAVLAELAYQIDDLSETDQTNAFNQVLAAARRLGDEHHGLVLAALASQIDELDETDQLRAFDQMLAATVRLSEEHHGRALAELPTFVVLVEPRRTRELHLVLSAAKRLPVQPRSDVLTELTLNLHELKKSGTTTRAVNQLLDAVSRLPARYRGKPLRNIIDGIPISADSAMTFVRIFAATAGLPPEHFSKVFNRFLDKLDMLPPSYRGTVVDRIVYAAGSLPPKHRTKVLDHLGYELWAPSEADSARANKWWEAATSCP